MMKRILKIVMLIMLAAPLMAVANPINLSFNRGGINQMSYSYDSNTGTYKFTTSGVDPYVYLSALTRSLADDEFMLSFEYLSPTGINDFRIYFGNNYAESRARSFGALEATSVWKEHQVNLYSSKVDFGWGKSGQNMRFDLGTQSGKTVSIRNVIISTGTDEDRAAYLRKQNLNLHLAEYLEKSYPCSVDNVDVSSSTITIQGTVPAGGQYKLVEITPYGDVTEDTEFEWSEDISDEYFSIQVLRNASRRGFRYDRLLSKWAIVDASGETPVLASHAHYADEVKAKASPREMPLKGKKGLGGFFMNAFLSDLDDLGIQSVTINVVCNQIISTTPGQFGNAEEYKFGGKTYYINMSSIANYDNTFKECYKRGIVTSAILLFTPTSPDTWTTKALCHPEYSAGYYTMPNMTTPEGVNTYAAIINYLANRYKSATYGRINHWIMHNEVDMGSEWTNMGDQPVNIYLDTYVKSMRLVYNIVRQYDQNAAVLGSYTHSWTQNSDGAGYNSKNMLEITRKYSVCEGDFWWGVAYHPYPQDLTKPCFWKDDTSSTYAMSSPYCTFKNLEVVNAWVLTPANLYRGETKRILFLSENGTNSPDYSATQLTNQAAGACWAWKKVKRLTGIDGMQWHNWFDNRQEFGLRIGLRRFGDDESEPHGRKPVWFVWQVADTDQEDAVFAPYLRTIGVASWNRIFHGSLTPVEDVLLDETADGPVRFFTLDGTPVGYTREGLRPGVYIARQGGRSRKVLVR